MPVSAQPDTIHVHCRVFDDVDGDGVRGAGETALASIRITNGLDVFLTDSTGAVTVPVDREVYRFATLTVPAGWWPTGPFFHWVPVGHAGPDTVEFGLAVRAETAADPVVWAHITDTHANTGGIPPPFTDALEAIDALIDRPLFTLNTGDLVERGDYDVFWQEYVAEVSTAEVQVLPVVGNHDMSPEDPLGPYERWVGPPYYSLEMGSWRFIAWNSEEGSCCQEEWLLNDLAAAPAGSHTALLQHRLSSEAPENVQALWATEGIRHVFSGHWHASQINHRYTDIVDYNLSWTVFGPVDRTPRGFGIVTCRADGTVDYELRRLGVSHRAFLVSPADGDTLAQGVVPVLVQAYDTSARVTTVTVTVNGPPPAPLAVPVTAEGISLWRGQIDLSALSDGDYTISADGQFEDGAAFSKTSSFRVHHESGPAPALGDEWPMFRKCPAGSSFTAQPLDPPLRLRWVGATQGMTALSSPVVADGKVLLGVRGERDPEGAGVAAFDAATGQPLWFTTVPSGIGLAPAVAGNVVLANAIADSVYGLDLATGQRLWATYKWNETFDGTAPIVEGPQAWVGGRPRLLQIRWVDGTLEWLSPIRGPDFYPYIYGAPAVDGERVYAGGFSHSFWSGSAALAALSRLDGAMEVWNEGGAWRSPICAGDTVYVVGGYQGSTYNPEQYLSMRRSDGFTVWTSPRNLMKETASPALGHGVIVTSGKPTSEGGKVHGFDAQDGALLWSHAVGTELFDMTAGKRRSSSTSSSPAIADDVVWVGLLDGHLVALDLFTGAELWHFFLGTPIASSPAISGDYLFVGASDGHLYAFARAGASSQVSSPGAVPAPARFRFLPPAPNPGRGGTAFAWEMPARADVVLKLYDVRGRLLRILVQERFEAGAHRLRWDGRDGRGDPVPSGVYFARIDVGESRAVHKWVHLRR